MKAYAAPASSVPEPKLLRYVVAGVIALGLLLAGFGTWATQTRLAGAIITPGVVQADLNRQIVQHATGGIVSDVLVRDGDLVSEGDVLVRLDTGAAQAALAAAQEHLFDLSAQRDRLRAIYLDNQSVSFAPFLLAYSDQHPALSALLAGQREMFRAAQATMSEQVNQLRQQTAQINAQLAGIDGHNAALQVQLTLIEVALENQKDLLARRLVPAATVLDLERERSRLLGDIAQVVGQRAQAKERLAGVEVERLQRMAQHREKAILQAGELETPMRRYRTEVQSLQAQIAQAEIRAPASGIIYGMKIHAAQSVLRPAEPVLYIVPQDRPPIFVAQVSPRHIDQVQVGQSVKLRLSALDQRLTPEILGKVSTISADVITDENTNASHYRVSVAPLAGELNKLPEGAVLLPGMPVEVFLQTGTWSPLQYLTKPVADYFARAFRES
ncbi:Type I secretion membrane fusion protein, HlyD family [Sulfitobacter noctilucae]|uniref:HlyD family type I secretion periplasmic adaptor subunit n=1 Tax=Sulfitobacter noctilucae TaxID=1342302 RepID=UPI000468220F|nr:HlyD family type I secretion periplasmic adaptor subunit [Sulfitobacter noctilucae]KIN65478.1 Type I secretion membrane fusion protein, HlyD family [Sulfitobacter noctilucae]